MRPLAAALILLVLFLASCSRSTVSQYFYLTPLDPAPESGAGGPSIGVEMVALPGYADRENIVTARGAHELGLDDLVLWAEPLEENVTSVLAENLAVLLSTDRVEVDSWPVGAVDYRVMVRVVSLVGEPGGTASLDARWSIHPEDGSHPPIPGQTHRSAPAGPDAASYVAALSGLMLELSREIAAAVPKPGY
jgi:uncharacterized lipoprotein YmbA